MTFANCKFVKQRSTSSLLSSLTWWLIAKMSCHVINFARKVYRYRGLYQFRSLLFGGGIKNIRYKIDKQKQDDFLYVSIIV